jgi:hypothetical protein
VPGWHEKTKRLEADGQLAVIGIVQEQHPARAALFMQWKQMDWPVMVDALNQLGVAVVPLTILIDESGVVRSTRPRGDALDDFLAAEPVEVGDAAPSPFALAHAEANEQLNFGTGDDLTSAIEQYEAGLASDDSGRTHFRLGVALRRRFESDRRQPDDFARAVSYWQRALAINPNQYIWRRRIQQYGPRLDKPYPFYDWVAQARDEIAARGETPVALPVEPRGAELAAAIRRFSADTASDAPDPDGRIARDRGLIAAEAVIVPHTSRDGVVRVHVTFRPNDALQAHWNNEATDMIAWFEPPPGWSIDRRRHGLAGPPGATSREARHLEVELRRDDESTAPPAPLTGYALYNVCEGAEGTCLYRRLDLHIPLGVPADAVDGAIN